jgi:hypothetical protein
MKRIERKPVEIIIHRDAYSAMFSIAWTGIELGGAEHVVAGIEELKRTMRALFALLEGQEGERANLVLQLEGILNTPILPEIVLAPAREELARWKEPSDAPGAPLLPEIVLAPVRE